MAPALRSRKPLFPLPAPCSVGWGTIPDVPVSRPVTIRDVAAAAGVSPRTVSNVVHGYVHVRDSTRANVQHHIDQLGYRPHAVGRQLRSGRTGVLALVVPMIDLPYFAELSACLVEAASEVGLTVAIQQTGGDVVREREVIAGAPVRYADAVVFSALGLTPAELEAAPPGTPLVLLGEHARAARTDHVWIDSIGVGRLATEHVLSRGRRRVGFLGTKVPAHATARERLAGWRAAHEAHGLPPVDSLVADVPGWDLAGGAVGTAHLLDRHPEVDAIVAANDVLALGALLELRRRGRQVPGDVAVVGVDDIAAAAFASPPLTTVALDRRHAAEQALHLAMTRSREPELPPRTVQAAHWLVVRESS